MFVPEATDVLLVVDVQNDFLPGGALAVVGGDEIVAPCRDLAGRFAHVVLTQDWHPAGHVSFASSHSGQTPFGSVALPDGRSQMLWPDHCVQGSPGAALADGLHIPRAELIIRKGYRRALDSYSAFVEADGRTGTGLAGYLRERGLRRVVVCGLATDFCAGWSAIDAARAGFETWLVTDATRGIDAAGSMARAAQDMKAAGVRPLTLADF
ncbi:bifunctional nicotinamidase/pyrazinamidase [Lichenihabitans sp. Uapishka_5]|uniref:bifunctional nicotinamidase/pyrazinamidase n=1 Tax=Lichenihabitans sp. Uapishka_5 TaxID=3037302 RepID=UPI0029E82269|nr:bifunctional nicotinamidase/pyrazinamidase [Lichenihabitans sp. Uapishka_5]MDX7949898.1 bifunctional nicotinamidase/pyrazinamidase [Lichenihabitans sp. Uapishka_5]